MNAMRKLYAVALLSALALGGCVDDPSDGEDELPSEDDEAATAAELSLPTCNSYSWYVHPWGYYYFRPSAGYNTKDTNCSLGYWNRNEGVAELQRSLRLCYNQNISVDGYFLSQTQEAVKNVQRFHGLYADGVFGPRTSAAMVWPKFEYIASNTIFKGCWF